MYTYVLLAWFLFSLFSNTPVIYLDLFVFGLDNPSFFVTVIMGITSYECSLYRSSKWRNMHNIYCFIDMKMAMVHPSLPTASVSFYLNFWLQFCVEYLPLTWLSSGAAGTSYVGDYRRTSTLLGVRPWTTICTFHCSMGKQWLLFYINDAYLLSGIRRLVFILTATVACQQPLFYIYIIVA